MALLNVFRDLKRTSRINDNLDELADRYIRNRDSGDPQSMAFLKRTPSRLSITSKDGHTTSYVVVGSDGQ